MENKNLYKEKKMDIFIIKYSSNTTGENGGLKIFLKVDYYNDNYVVLNNYGYKNFNFNHNNNNEKLCDMIKYGSFIGKQLLRKKEINSQNYKKFDVKKIHSTYDIYTYIDDNQESNHKDLQKTQEEENTGEEKDSEIITSREELKEREEETEDLITEGAENELNEEIEKSDNSEEINISHHFKNDFLEDDQFEFDDVNLNNNYFSIKLEVNYIQETWTIYPDDKYDDPDFFKFEEIKNKETNMKIANLISEANLYGEYLILYETGKQKIDENYNKHYFERLLGPACLDLMKKE